MSPSASTARSLTHQSLSFVASIRYETARSSLVWFSISIAVRRTSSSLSETSSSAELMTCGPPIFPSASAARLRTHQSASRIARSRYLIELSSPTTFSTSTAARRACSDSSFSTSTRWRTVSGCLLRHRSSMAGFWTSSSGSRSSGATSAGSTWPLPFAMARKAADLTSLLGSFSVLCSAARTLGVSKRASSEMMCVRAMVSLPSTRATSSSTLVASTSSPAMRKSAAFSLGSCR